jgi:hypothetical protein
MIESTVEPKSYVKVLLDDTGELVAVQMGKMFYLPSNNPNDKLPPKITKDWDLKTLTIWHNTPCCIKSGSKLICWPPCIV